MEPSDLTVKILQEMRDDQRELIARLDQRFEKMDERFERMDQRFEKMDQRFEVIETVLRDLAQPIVILGRGVKVAIEERRTATDRWDDHEARIRALEQRAGGS